MRVGFIGLGAMGAPMAQNLLGRGHELTVFARRKEAMAPLLAKGARPASSPAEAAALSDVTIAMVFDAAAVAEVALGPGGVAEGAHAGSVFVDHSTIAPDAARRIAEALQGRGISMLDAPVSGGAMVAAAGTLSVMVGGEEAALARSRPALECYAKTITYIGPSGSGQIAKACNQICTIVNMLGAAEAMLLAERAGVDPTRVKDVLLTGFGASRILELQAPKMIARAFDGNVESRLHHKDIQIVLEMAKTMGISLPASSAAADVLTKLQERGGAKRDSAAMFEILDSARRANPPEV
jgi:3-hydroxyisobutyrate dehydrogenase-like beta-hydroxyacid dehydrogenase